MENVTASRSPAVAMPPPESPVGHQKEDASRHLFLILASMIERSFCEAKYTQAHSGGMSPNLPWGHQNHKNCSDTNSFKQFFFLGLL
jgi:hypothetical protein